MLVQPLRERQDWTLQECRQAFREGDYRPMVQGPTGFGKTALAAHLAWRAVEKGKTVTFSVPAIPLVNQTDRIFQRFGIPAEQIGVIQADHPRTNKFAPIQIASIQTLVRRNLVPTTDVWMVDEAHKWFKFYGKCFQAPIWERKPIIGLSATPWTVGLGRYYGRLIRPATIRQLINEGLLAEYDYFAPPGPKTSDIPLDTRGEFSSLPAGERMSEKQIVADVVETWSRLHGKPWTFCFAQNRAHAAKLLTWFSNAGIPCGYMDALTPEAEREETFRLYRAKEIQILVNVGVLVLGVDEPCDCIILAMITMSEMRYVQIVGRGLRPGETGREISGRKRLLILDHGDNLRRLGLFEAINYGTLDGGKVKPARERAEGKLKACPKCNYVKMKGERVCPKCNYVAASPPSSVKHVDGELICINGILFESEADRILAEKQRFYQDMRCWQQLRGWNPLWAAIKYNERWGEPVPASFSDLPLVGRPLKANQSWIMERLREYRLIKARERKGGQDLIASPPG